MAMNIIAIDPGTTQSAYVLWNGKLIILRGIIGNDELILKLYQHNSVEFGSVLAIEKVACYGMPVGAEVFDTCIWTGRFWQAWQDSAGVRDSLVWLIERRKIKMHLCQDSRAKDANIRQALIDSLGAPGRKKEPGVTYGIHSHEWAALALAVTCHDLLNTQPPKDIM